MVLHQPELAEKYLLEANKLYKLVKNKYNIAKNYLDISESYNLSNQFKKSLITLDSAFKYTNNESLLSLYYVHKSDAHKGMGDLNTAIFMLQKAIELDKKLEDNYAYAADINQLGTLYLKKGNKSEAFKQFEEAKSLFANHSIEDMVIEKQVIRNYIATFLSLNHPSLFTDFDRYLLISDSLNEQSSSKHFVELDAKYQSSQKEAQIAQQQLKIQKGHNMRNLAIGGGLFVILLSAIGFLILRQKQKRKELNIKNSLLNLQNELNQSELNKLNKQLDPHEIKNLLASISPEIQEKAPESYHKMLRLFNITKSSLNNAITENLNIQLKQVEDYLSLMKETMFEPLTYEIDNQIKNTNIAIPRLLLKNLVENAVKHGIKGKAGGGSINVHIKESEDYLYITVDDTGKGRANAISKDSGIGTTTYKHLFDTLNIRNKAKANLEITDKQEGTLVTVRIPYNYKYE